MDFDSTRGELAFLESLDRTLDQVSEADLAPARERLLAALGALAPTGYLRLPSPELGGGAGWIEAIRHVADRDPSLAFAAETSLRLFGRALKRYGDSSQRSRWLEPILRGEAIGALGLAEASNNVVNDPLQTRGERKGELVEVTGRKRFVCNAPIADWIALAGTLDGEGVLFIVESSAEGLRISPPLETIALEGAAFASVEVSRCRLPLEQVLFVGPERAMAAELRRWEDEILTGMALGLMTAALDEARTYARQHRTVQGKPIAAFQAIAFQLAELLTLTETARLLAARAAWAAETAEAGWEELIIVAKLFCTEQAEAVTSSALQILSIDGLFKTHRAARASRAAKMLRVLGTSSEVGRNILGDAAIERWG